MFDHFADTRRYRVNTNEKYDYTLHKKPKFRLNFYCENFVEKNSFYKVSGDLPKTLRKLFVFIKISHHKISWYSGNLRSDNQTLKQNILLGRLSEVQSLLI